VRRRILLLVNWYPNVTLPVSGAFIRDQARLLAERFEVNVLAVYPIGLRTAFRDRRHNSIEHDGKVVVYRVYAPTPPYIPHLRLLSSAYVAWRELHKYIRRHGCPDLIHAHVVLPCGWVAAQASRAWNIPALLTEHSSPFTVHLYPSLQRWGGCASVTGGEHSRTAD